MRDDLIAVLLHHLARHRAVQVAAGEGLDEAWPAFFEPELQRVAVERAQAIDFAVVVERRLVLQRCIAQRLQADDLQFGDRGPGRRLPARIGETLDRVDEILRHQFAPLSFECRVVLEVDAGADADGPGPEVLGRLRHALGHIGNDLERPRQVVIRIQPIENMRGDDARVQVRQLRRIESGLGNRERVAQHLGWPALRERGGRHAEHQRGEQRRAQRGV